MCGGGAVLVLVAASGGMYWVLSGFQPIPTFYGSWPAMLATVIGMFSAAHAAKGKSPVTAGVILGVAGLFNATVIPGVVAVCVALLISSGLAFGQALRWCATSASAALAVSAWWLVPFATSWERLVRWEVPLSTALSSWHPWQPAAMAVIGVAAAWAARVGAGPARCLALASLAGLGATLLADLFGYLRPERWLELPVLVAAMAAGGLAARLGSLAVLPARPAWAVVASAGLIVFAVVTLRFEVLPLAVWLMWRPQPVWAWAGALAWAAVLLWVPVPLWFLNPPDAPPVSPLEAAVAQTEADDDGLVYVESRWDTKHGAAGPCQWGNPWGAAADTDGRIRPLWGLYRETSSAAEFLDALEVDHFSHLARERPHWFEVGQVVDRQPSANRSAASALGARWYVTCDIDGSASVAELAAPLVSGVTIAPHVRDEQWHRSAVEWWMQIASDSDPEVVASQLDVPTHSAGDTAEARAQRHQAASDLALHTAPDRLTVTAATAGWAWIRVPWDPYWQADNGGPVHKGGPGHLVVWADEGTTELRWQVPGAMDATAAGVSGLAMLSVAVLSVINRRRGWYSDPDRRRPAAYALSVFADTVDGWWHAAARNARACSDDLADSTRATKNSRLNLRPVSKPSSLPSQSFPASTEIH